jgi:hypothetical protein
MEKELTGVIERGVKWMLAQSALDGSYRDALPALGAYYKTPYFWAVSGHPAEFGRTVRFMQEVFYGPEGFHSEVDPQATAYTSYFFNYMMGWVARGTWVGGAFAFARRAYEYLVQPQGKTIIAACDQGPTVTTGTRNIGSAANAGVSFLYAGDMASAQHCADFVWSVFEKQDWEDEFFVRTDAEGEILRDFPQDEQAISVIDMHKPDQMYWHLGIAMALFGKMFEATGQPAYLDRAAVVFDVFDRCRPNVAGDDLTVGKVAYGTAILYRLTGQEHYLTVCRECADNLIRSQESDGFWLYDRRGDIKVLNRSTLLDFCAELTTWCMEVTKELAGAR